MSLADEVSEARRLAREARQRVVESRTVETPLQRAERQLAECRRIVAKYGAAAKVTPERLAEAEADVERLRAEAHGGPVASGVAPAAPSVQVAPAERQVPAPSREQRWRERVVRLDKPLALGADGGGPMLVAFDPGYAGQKPRSDVALQRRLTLDAARKVQR